LLGNEWSVRVWDLSSGEERLIGDTFALKHGQEDKPLFGLAVAPLTGRVRVAFSSRYGKIMVGDYPIDGQQTETHLYPYDTWYLREAEEEYVRCLASYIHSDCPRLAASTDNGLLAILNLKTGEIEASWKGRADQAIHALCFSELDGRTVLVTGGVDGALCLWSMQLALLLKIEFGQSILAIAKADTNLVLVGTSRGLTALRIAI
jgi:WD40 repeat protein